MVSNMKFNHEKMRVAAAIGHSTATDLADYLVHRGLAFRDAHEVVGGAVRCAESKGVELHMLSLSELQSISDLIADDVYGVLTLEGSVNSRDHVGGTAPSQVRQAINRAQTEIASR